MVVEVRNEGQRLSKGLPAKGGNSGTCRVALRVSHSPTSSVVVPDADTPDLPT
jgi:hypothetical protein